MQGLRRDVTGHCCCYLWVPWAKTGDCFHRFFLLGDRGVLGIPSLLGGGFNDFLMLAATWGNDPI